MSRSFLVPGAIAGFLLGLATLGLGKAGLDYATREILVLAAMALAAAVAQFAALRNARGELPLDAFPPRYFLAMLAGAVTAAAYGLAAWLHYAVIDTTFLARVYAEYLERAQGAAASAEERQQLVEAAERMKEFVMDPFAQAMVQFGTLLMIALLTGLAVSLFAGRGSANRQ